MVPEVREALDAATAAGSLPNDGHYPFAELAVCMGFFIVYAIEAIVHKFFGGGKGGDSGGHGHSHGLPQGFGEDETDGGQEMSEGVDNGGFSVADEGGKAEARKNSG